MTQKYELIVKGIRNFENKVTVTLALRDKKRFDGEIFDLDISLDHVEGAALEFYEAAARRSIRQVFLDVAAGLCEGDELLPETRPCSEARYTIKINSSDKMHQSASRPEKKVSLYFPYTFYFRGLKIRFSSELRPISPAIPFIFSQSAIAPATLQRVAKKSGEVPKTLS